MKQTIDVITLTFQRALTSKSFPKLIAFCSLCFVFISGYAQSQRTYEVPPSSSTTARALSIPDADMERCVEIYNEASWLKDELNNTQVDIYNQTSVNVYNSKASQYAQMADYYNMNCAGKQSKPAVKATLRLNQLNGQ